VSIASKRTLSFFLSPVDADSRLATLIGISADCITRCIWKIVAGVEHAGRQKRRNVNDLSTAVENIVHKYLTFGRAIIRPMSSAHRWRSSGVNFIVTGDLFEFPGFSEGYWNKVLLTSDVDEVIAAVKVAVTAKTANAIVVDENWDRNSESTSHLIVHDLQADLFDLDEDEPTADELDRNVSAKNGILFKNGIGHFIDDEREAVDESHFVPFITKSNRLCAGIERRF
jgi:hypothetical protein